MQINALKLAIAPAQCARFVIRQVIDRYDPSTANDAEKEALRDLIQDCENFVEIARLVFLEDS